MLKHIRYGRYVLRHKLFVFIAGLKTGAPVHRLIIHDWSKFLPSEWFPYAEFFYGKGRPGREAMGTYSATSAKDPAFLGAWLRHQNRQPHHWQWWILLEDSPKDLNNRIKVMPIPEPYVREMVADWMGAGRAITGKWDILSWYDRNKANMVMHEDARALVEQLLSDIFPKANAS